MYVSFFGFRAKPFNDRPELRFHYVTPAYAENFNAVRRSIRTLEGLQSLIGESGSGKTLFLDRLEAASRNQSIQYIRPPGRTCRWRSWPPTSVKSWNCWAPTRPSRKNSSGSTRR